MIHTISNLYPLPGDPLRGAFNAQLFARIHVLNPVLNTVIVPSAAPIGDNRIRNWCCPEPIPPTRYIPYRYLPVIGRNRAHHLVARSLPLIPPPPDKTPILASWLYPDGCAAATVHGSAGHPVFVMVLGSDAAHLQHPARGQAIRAAEPCTTGYICVAHHLAEALRTAGIPAPKVHVILNGADTTRFRPDADESARLRTSLYPAVDPLIVFCGNLVDVKNPLLALEAFARLAGPLPRSGLVIIGRGKLRGRLERRARQLGISGRVHFAGCQSRAIMPDWFRRADILLLTSRTEGMPNVVVEALACGTPVAATAAGACREMLRGQPCCHIADAATPAGVAAAIMAGLHDRAATTARPALRRDWSEMARDILDCMLF